MDFESSVYHRKECVTFRKVDEEFGGLSNMSGDYPLEVNGVDIKTSEALYQACRFPDHPVVQGEIIAQASPMAAKMRSKPSRKTHGRADWDAVRVDVMRWCLRVKLACNWVKFGRLLLRTGDRPIVEDSPRDGFWGAVPSKGDPDLLQGQNVLGKLLMELREELKGSGRATLAVVPPPAIPNLLIDGKPVGTITVDGGAFQRGEPVFTRLGAREAA